jgi:hypothetical protein
VKLNEFKQLNELDLAQAFGDYGSAAIQQTGSRLNPFNKTGSDQLSVQDKMAKNIFLSKMIGRASADLDSAIKGGLVDPKIKGGQAPAAPAQPTTTPATSTTPLPTTQQAPAGETPEQKRIRLQKAAQQNIDKTAAPVSKLPVNQPAVQAGNIRQAKQQVAGANAQAQMATNPAPAKPGAPKTPEQIRQEKQAAATQTAQGQMAANPAPAQPQQPAPTQQSKMTPQQVAALKGKLKAGATPTSGQSGFKKYVGGSGAVQRESTYSKLDYILESIINIDEAEVASKQSISDFIQRFFKKYLQIQIIPSQVQTQVTTLANEIESTYPRNKDALTKLANLGYAFSYSNQDDATDTANASATKPATNSFAAGIQQGLGKPTTASATAVPAIPGTTTPTSTTAPATTTDPTVAGPATTSQPTSTTAPAQGTAYKQAIGLLGKLDKKGKQRILSYIEKQLGNSSSATPATTGSDPGANAFAQMGKQITQPGATATSTQNQNQATKSSTGGKIQQTGLGTVHTKSRDNQNIKRRTRVKPNTDSTNTDQTITNRQQKLATRKTKAPV